MESEAHKGFNRSSFYSMWLKHFTVKNKWFQYELQCMVIWQQIILIFFIN